MSMLEIKNVHKSFFTYTKPRLQAGIFHRPGARKVTSELQVLRGVDLTVEKGDVVAILGPSGSGKTTLLRCLNFLETADTGSITVAGETLWSAADTKTQSEEAIHKKRLHFGLVFQDFNLLDNFSLKDNIFLPLVLSGVDYRDMEKRLAPIASLLGIEKLLNKYPYEVSGGQKQRAAVARAIITNPELILADEPTGALDSKATDSLLRLFNRINEDGQTILMVTHSTKAASHANRVLFIKDGQVFHQVYRGNLTNDELYVKIQDALMLITTGGEKHE